VLGAEKRDELDVRCFVKRIDHAAEFVRGPRHLTYGPLVDTCVVGHEADAFPPN
jgi:hypothetical protein